MTSAGRLRPEATAAADRCFPQCKPRRREAQQWIHAACHGRVL